jgi:hypothetical protein
MRVLGDGRAGLHHGLETHLEPSGGYSFDMAAGAFAGPGPATRPLGDRRAYTWLDPVWTWSILETFTNVVGPLLRLPDTWSKFLDAKEADPCELPAEQRS